MTNFDEISCWRLLGCYRPRQVAHYIPAGQILSSAAAITEYLDAGAVEAWQGDGKAGAGDDHSGCENQIFL